MHTLRTIAEDTGESKDTIRKRYERAKAKHGELGTLVKGVRTFTDEEREILDSFAADPKPVEPQYETKVEVSSQPSNGARFEPIGGKLAFNPDAMLGRSNGTAHTVQALDQVSAVALQLKQGVLQAAINARYEYEQIADAAQGAENQLRELELAISESRAITTILEMQKRQSVKQGVETQAKIESMMQGGE